ncbi:MAG: hypothetical protein VKP70_04810, partial [Cyanobacteriota bacterium]|nr:hypothetical protein [Cyanobacteriota bacterium]
MDATSSPSLPTPAGTPPGPLAMAFFGLGAVGSSRIDVVGLPHFAPLFDGSAPELQRLAGAQVLVNAAHPGFNRPLLELGLRLRAHVVDLASDMYDAETEGSLTFSQYAFDQAYRE